MKLTGGILELEIEDNVLDKIIDSSLREIQRYICSPLFITIPFTKCIDMKKATGGLRVAAIEKVLRTSGVTQGDAVSDDPMVISQWQLVGGLGNLYNFQDSMDNFLAWNTLLKIRNTTSTDLAFIFDEHDQKLYINTSTNLPSQITISFIPQYNDVEQIKDNYWIDNLMQMCVAQTKIVLGRIRSRYKSNDALWSQDGDTILQEGLDEYKALQEYLRNNTNLLYAID